MAATPVPPHYTGLDLSLTCTVVNIQVPGVTASVQINDPQNMAITNSSRITVGNVVEVTVGTVFQQSVLVRPLSALADGGTFTCTAFFIPTQPNSFVLNSLSRMAIQDLMVTGIIMYIIQLICSILKTCNFPDADPTLSVSLPAVTTRVLDIPPYNSFTLTCTATSSVSGTDRAILKSFTWTRRIGSGAIEMIMNSTNGVTITGSNLDQATSISTLQMTTMTAGEHMYTCSSSLVVSPAMDDITGSDQQTVTVQGL